MLHLHMLGGFSASNEAGASLTLPRHRWALLALIAAAGDRGVSRDKVLACLWPEIPDDKGRARLQQMLHSIRQSLGAQTFLPGDPLRLGSGVVRSDVAEFRNAIDAGDLESACVLYRGPLLDGFHLGDAPEFEYWLERERNILAETHALALRRLATDATAAGNHSAAVRLWRELAATDPLNSQMARDYMKALAATGDRTGALRHAALHGALVRSELGVEPDAVVRQFVAQLSADAGNATATPLLPPLHARQPAPGPSLVEARFGVAEVDTDESRVPTRGVDLLSGVTHGRGPRLGTPSVANHGRWLLTAGAAVAIVIAGANWLRSARDPEVNTIVVAPFDVFDPALALWRNGLVDVLSRNFDGSGPLRAVSASIAIGRWKGRADIASATALASKAGAQLAVYGSLLPSGRDSIRVRASLLDAPRGVVIAEVEVREADDRMDRVADSISAHLLLALSRTRNVGLLRMASLGSGNPNAIKAFLKGSQFVRDLRMDSAVVHFTRAIEADSGFALAYTSRASIPWRTQGFTDSVAALDAFHAAALNRGLSRRDSLLIQTDSLYTALSLLRLPRSHIARLFALVETAAGRYPDDPQVMQALGEVWYHYGSWYSIVDTRERTANALKRAVAADSNNLDAYDRLSDLLADVNNAPELLKLLDARARHVPPDPERVLLRQILRGEVIDEAVAESFVRMRNTPMPGLLLKVFADTGEIGLRLLRRRYASRSVLPMNRTDSSIAMSHLASGLLRRGHWREAIGLPLTIGRQIVEPAVMGVAPDDTARMLLHHVVTRPPDRRVAMMLPWLARRRDTLAIDSILSDIAKDPPASDRPGAVAQVRFFAAVAPGFRALAIGDTTRAARILDALPDSQCLFPACTYVYFERVRLARAQGRFADAYAMSQFYPEYDIYGVGIAYVLERAHVAEKLGKREEAGRAYQHVLDAWRYADPEFRTYTEDAAAGLRRVRNGSRD